MGQIRILHGLLRTDVYPVSYTQLQRLRECSMMVTVPDGRAIPFCSYHLTDAAGARVYPPWGKEELR